MSEPAATEPLPHIVVVGGGISGLAAAWFLVNGSRGPRARITLLESGPDVGGKLQSTVFGGEQVDAGAESLLATRPEAVDLCKALGIPTVPASTTKAAIYSRGEMRAIPKGLVTGIPTDLRDLARSGVLSVPGLLRLPWDHLLPRTHLRGDISVGDYVTARLGSEVTDRLVEPLLGGVYAGRAEDLSLQMTVPALYRAASQRKSLLDAAKAVVLDGQRTNGPRKGPIFVGIEGGVATLAAVLRSELLARGVEVKTSCSARSITQADGHWRVTTSRRGNTLMADAVLLATPAPVSGELLSRVNQPAADELRAIDYASMAVVLLGYPAAEVGRLHGSGFLVPPVENRVVKAVTFSTTKWSWLGQNLRSTAADGLVVMRASIGRAGEEQWQAMSDADLSGMAARDLQDILGLPADPALSQVVRWVDGLPQYSVGHRTRVAEIRQWLVSTPGLAVCGAAYDGVGVAACIGSAQAAVSTVLQQLAERRQWAHG